MDDTLDVRRKTLLSPTARNARRTERQRQVLRFLREEIWSSTELLGQVMGIGTPQGVHKALLALEKDGLLSRMPVTICGRRALSVWGITPHGQALAFDVEAGELPISAYFEPSRVALVTMDHHLDTQRLRLQAERARWLDWVPGARLGRSTPKSKRPDAIAKNPSGLTVALEIERTIKTNKRYEAILSHYLQSVKHGDYSYVQYLSPTKDFSVRLSYVIRNIKAVPVRGARVSLKDEHYRVFRFNAYSEWPHDC